MSEIEFSKFVWFKKEPKPPQLSITVPNSSRINLNAKLMLQMPDRIKIGVMPDGKTICICETSDEGYHLPKNGSLPEKRIIRMLMKNNIVFPARYTVTKQDDKWIGVLDEDITVKSNSKKICKPGKYNSEEVAGLKTELRRINEKVL